jgi:hypothetical protein
METNQRKEAWGVFNPATGESKSAARAFQDYPLIHSTWVKAKRAEFLTIAIKIKPWLSWNEKGSARALACHVGRPRPAPLRRGWLLRTSPMAMPPVVSGEAPETAREGACAPFFRPMQAAPFIDLNHSIF